MKNNTSKKIILSLLASALVATSSFALDTSKAYAMGSGFAIILGGGLPVVEAGKAGPGTVAVEAELTYSLMAPSLDYGYGSVDLTVMTLGAYGAYIFDINEQFFVKPRAGLVYRSYSYSNGGYYGDSISEIGVALGVQGGFKLNKQLDVIVGFNMLDGGDLTHLSAGVQYHF